MFLIRKNSFSLSHCIFRCLTLFCSLQVSKFVEWAGVKLLLANGEKPGENASIMLFTASVLTAIIKKKFLQLYPLGGQHYCGANDLARAIHPQHPMFQKYLAYVFLPMPKHMADQVRILK